MVANQYQFVTQWRLSGSVEDLFALVSDGLGYTWTSRRTEKEYPHRAVYRAQGDFDGWAIWTVEQQGAEVVATLDWRLNAEKPLLKLLSPILKPLFRWNHYWAMNQGYEAIKRELGARRSQSA